jgi:hypothetical protein
MENIMLSWFILTETHSVLWLSLYGSLQFMGTLLAPFFGIVGHHLGNKKVYSLMRLAYFSLAVSIGVLIVLGQLHPLPVFVISFLMGLIRPSDQVLRHTLLVESIDPKQLSSAASLSRTTQDSARLMGALTGAGLVVYWGMGFTYIGVIALYAVSWIWSLKIARPVTQRNLKDATLSVRALALRDLKEGVNYVRSSPVLSSGMWLAFWLNLTVFPLTNGLLPYVAKEVYHLNQTGLGYWVACVAGGALIGSLSFGPLSQRLPLVPLMFCSSALWPLALIVFVNLPGPEWASVLLVITGYVQSQCMIPLTVTLLSHTVPQHRGQVMGLRILMIYGIPIGLMIAGPLITQFGFAFTATLYCMLALIGNGCIAWHWYRGWRRSKS